MTVRRLFGTAGLALLAVMLVWPGAAAGAPIITMDAGATAADIQDGVDAFRALLGNPNNGNAPGPLASGRREINWDGGGFAVSPAGNPFTGFQVIRGATFNTPGTGFVQAPPTGPMGGLDTFFMNPTYANFDVFSLQRLFSPVGSNITDVTFTIPGNPGVPAFVSGFGAVFSDVDLANTTSLQFFDVFGASLGTFFAPTFNDGLSFLGVTFNAGEQVARVRITTGNAAPGPNDGGMIDVVMMDDFLFSEPQVIVPEPASLVLLGAGALGVLVHACRRRKRVVMN